jgi:hypothetical protein
VTPNHHELGLEISRSPGYPFLVLPSMSFICNLLLFLGLSGSVLPIVFIYAGLIACLSLPPLFSTKSASFFLLVLLLPCDLPGLCLVGTSEYVR